MKQLQDNPREPFQLFRKDKEGNFVPTMTVTKSEIWVCGECGQIHHRWTDEEDQLKRAADCCKQKYCACGEKLNHYWLKCSNCQDHERMKKLITESTEIDTFDGPVFIENQDRYFSDLGEFEDWARDRIEDDEEDSIPEWVWPCDTRGFGKLDANDVIQHELDELFEDAIDSVEDLDGLQSALDAWVDKQTLQSYSPNFKHRINVQKLLKGPQ